MHQVALSSWPAPDDQHLVYAEGLTIGGRSGIDISARPRDVVVVEGPADSGKTALLLTLAGRMQLAGGHGAAAKVKIGGLVLPEQAGRVRAKTGYLDCASSTDLRRDLRSITRSRPAVIFLDNLDVLTLHDDRAAVASLLGDLKVQAYEQAVFVAVRDHAAVVDLVAGPFSTLSLAPAEDLVDADRH
jgi:RND superfamily putative drug exporter